MSEETTILSPEGRSSKETRRQSTMTEETQQQEAKTDVEKDSKAGKKKAKIAGVAGIAGAAGLAAGVLTPPMAFPQSAEDIQTETMEASASVGHHVGHEMPVAHGIDDSMSFNEAFAAARHEVGAGGLFQWHGNTYGTYYGNEWNSMSADDRAQYWADVNHTTSHLNDEALASNGSEQEPTDLGGETYVDSGETGETADTDDIPTNPDDGWDDEVLDGEGELAEGDTNDDWIPEGTDMEFGDVIDADGDGVADAIITDINANEMPDVILDTDGDGAMDAAIMDVSIVGTSGVVQMDGDVLDAGIAIVDDADDINIVALDMTGDDATIEMSDSDILDSDILDSDTPVDGIDIV